MSLSTVALVAGTVARVEVYSGTITAEGPRKGQPFTIRTVTIIGPTALGGVLASVTIPDALELPKEGSFVLASIEVGVRRDDDTARLISWIDPGSFVAALKGEK